MADQIKIEIDVETRAAIAELAKIEKATREVKKEAEKLTIAQLAWKAANSDLGKISKGWQEAAELYGKVGLAFATVTAAGVAFAAHLEQQERIVSRLGPAYQSIVLATNGVITAQQALTLQGQIQAAGIQVNERAIVALTRQAREWADATGNDASQAIEKLTNAIVNNSEDALSEMNLSMARGATGAQTLANVVRELETRFQGASPPARTLQQDIAKLPQALEALGATALQTATGPLETLFNGFMRISGAIGGINTEGMTFRRGLTEIANIGDEARGRNSMAAASAAGTARMAARDRLYSAMQESGARLNSTSQAQFGNLSNLSESERGRVMRAITMWSASGASSASESLNRELAAISEGRLQTEVRTAQTASDARETALSAERKGRRNRVAGSGGGGGGGDASAIRSAREAYNAAVADGMSRDAVLVLPDDMPRNSGETLAAYFTRLADIQREFNSAGATNDLAPTNAAEMQSERDKAEAAFAEDRAGVTRDRDRTQRRASRDRETRRMAHEQSAAGQIEQAVGLERDEFGNAKAFDMAGGAVNALKETLPVLKSGFSEMFMAIADGSKSAGEAFQEFASKTLTALGQMSINEGIALMFKGAVALVTAPPVAPVYLAAGAGLIALGVGLGAAGAATKPSVPAPGSGAGGTQAARGLAPRSSLGSSMGEMGAVTVVQSSLVPAGPVDAQRARDGLRTVRRQGFGDRAPRRIEH